MNNAPRPKVVSLAPGEPVDLDLLIKSRQTVDLPVQAGDEWRQVNDASIDEYLAHHGAEQYPEMVKTHMALFAGFVAKHLLAVGGRTVLDVGCGVGTQYPLYVRDMAGAINYIGLDPIKINLERDYPFVCGRLEDLAKQGLTRPADVVLFATSLDHFENVQTALALAGGLVGTGRVLLWVGLHDSAAVSSVVGAKVFARLCEMTRLPVLRLGGLLAYALLHGSRLFFKLNQRERTLASGGRLDKFHFHYFLRDTLLQILEQSGAVEELVLLPGSNSCFVALRVQS
jgi:SAM-dependent methyltransferase